MEIEITNVQICTENVANETSVSLVFPTFKATLLTPMFYPIRYESVSEGHWETVGQTENGRYIQERRVTAKRVMRLDAQDVTKIVDSYVCAANTGWNYTVNLPRRASVVQWWLPHLDVISSFGTSVGTTVILPDSIISEFTWENGYWVRNHMTWGWEATTTRTQLTWHNKANGAVAPIRENQSWRERLPYDSNSSSLSVVFYNGITETVNDKITVTPNIFGEWETDEEIILTVESPEIWEGYQRRTILSAGMLYEDEILYPEPEAVVTKGKARILIEPLS